MGRFIAKEKNVIMPVEWTLLERSMGVGIAEASEKLFHLTR